MTPLQLRTLILPKAYVYRIKSEIYDQVEWALDDFNGVWFNGWNPRVKQQVKHESDLVAALGLAYEGLL